MIQVSMQLGIESIGEDITPEKNAEKFLRLNQLWQKEIYPDDYLLCKIAFSLARKCHELHLKGFVIANEWNEGNILIDIKDCSVSIESFHSIDLDGYYRGTTGYLAPEYYMNHKYDLYSDYYGLATFLYRMFIGGFSLDGKNTVEYLKNNNHFVQEVAPIIYGCDALFAFNSHNVRNTIRNFVDPLNPRMYELQTQCWDSIDERIKEHFIQIFSDSLQDDSRIKWASDREWMQTFKVIAKSDLKTCPVCQRRLFVGRMDCPWCK